MNFDELEIQCPHCGETICAPVDPSQGMEQEFIEDCAVCCRAIVFRIRLAADEDSQVEISAERS
jgi:hypothetical protein